MLNRKGASVHLRPPPDYWCTFFLFLAGPGPVYWYTSSLFLAGPGLLPEIAASAFSRNTLGCANTFSFLALALTPPIFASVPPLSPCFLALEFSFPQSFLLLLSCAPQNFSMNSVSCFPPTSFHTFSTTLSHLIPARPFVTFSHTAYY